ncbi:hypothetical protein BY458DRAFT_520279 [Sporodiniella umbellata]|nr:hypothetical protein BY458DRAFT_520279 [Sporodiniella umbellata]
MYRDMINKLYLDKPSVIKIKEDSKKQVKGYLWPLMGCKIWNKDTQCTPKKRVN